MPIGADDVRKIAHLARIELDETEVGRFADQLGAILGYVEKLSEVDVTGVEPFLSAAAPDNAMRADAARAGLPTEQALANAPEQGEGFFKVPEIIG